MLYWYKSTHTDREDAELVYKLINTAHTRSNVPITAKMRVFEDDDKTLQYAKMLVDAGAQLLTGIYPGTLNPNWYSTYAHLGSVRPHRSM